MELSSSAFDEDESLDLIVEEFGSFERPNAGAISLSGVCELLNCGLGDVFLMHIISTLEFVLKRLHLYREDSLKAVVLGIAVPEVAHLAHLAQAASLHALILVGDLECRFVGHKHRSIVL